MGSGTIVFPDNISCAMPERTFGRTIRSRRTKLGLSQAKLGELVGKSASTIRSWEKDKRHPTDGGVITALAAILGADERQLFERAGQAVPDQEDSPTIEQALATLSPAPLFDSPEVVEERPSTLEAEPDVEDGPTIEQALATLSPALLSDSPEVVEEPVSVDDTEPDIEKSPTVERALATPAPDPQADLSESVETLPSFEEVDAVGEPGEDTFRVEDNSEIENLDPELAPDSSVEMPDSDELPEAAESAREVRDDLKPIDVRVEAAAYTAPAEPYVVAAPVASSVGSSYLEERSQRQLYLVRNLATIVVLVGLVVALLWALSESMAAIGDWWDEFFGNLRL